jgi:hypothetical protein
VDAGIPSMQRSHVRFLSGGPIDWIPHRRLWRTI